MKFILLILCLSLTGQCFAASESVNKSKSIDGKIAFPVCKTGDLYFYSQAEAEAHFAISPSSAEVNQEVLSLDSTELAISTCSYITLDKDRFLKCISSKDSLSELLSEMQNDYQVAKALNNVDKIHRYKRLEEIAQSLP